MNNTNITLSFLEKIEKANKDFRLFDGVQKILVGLSGGADSTALLVSLASLSEKYGFELYALHVNHMIRGEEADRDELFSKNLCEKFGIKFFAERVDVPFLSKKNSQSLELCARNVRYGAFEKVCRENGITCVATAHNLRDNAETVLFNLSRGSGTRGLCGIPVKRKLCDGVDVIRPLIYIDRPEIEEYLGFLGQDFVTDSTNCDNCYSRNFIRNEILPSFSSLNPKISESLMRSARLHGEDEDFLSKTANECVTDSLQELSKLHVAVLSRVVMILFGRVSKETPSEVHISNLCEKIYEYDGKKTKVSFADGFSAKLYGDRLTFEKDGRIKKNEKTFFCIEIGEGEVFFEENPYSLYITFDQNKDIPKTLENKENIYKLYNTDYLYSAKIPDSLYARNRRDGDKILSGNMHKSLKRLLCASGLDGVMRDMLPVICMDEDIILVPGVAVCDSFKKRRESTRQFSVSVYIKDNSTQE